jgi:hypothetical protein
MKRAFVSFVFISFVLGLFSGCSSRSRETEEYKIKAQSLGKLISGQASACVSQSKAYQAVWEYAKVSDMDFDTAAAQMLGPETEQNKATMMEHKVMIEDLLEELKEPPSSFDEAYRKLEELYDIYIQLHDLAMDPLDDMEKHMRSVNELADRMAAKMRELDASWFIK